MPAPKSSSGSSKGSGRSRSSARSTASRSSGKTPGSQRKSSTRTRTTAGPQKRSSRAARAGGAVADGLSSLVEQLTNRIIKPLDLVMLSRERIQDTLDEAADRGRVTRSDANELVAELVQRGRQQTDDLLGDIERLLGRGREQLGSASKRTRLAEPVGRLVRGADRARRNVDGESLPIPGYDELTARQVMSRLSGLSPPELRKMREYERRHANRKSVLTAIERELA